MRSLELPAPAGLREAAPRVLRGYWSITVPPAWGHGGWTAFVYDPSTHLGALPQGRNRRLAKNFAMMTMAFPI